MTRYVVKRIVQAVGVIFGVITVTFIVLRVIPSNPARALLPLGAPASAIAKLQTQLGLDGSIISQYGKFLSQVVHGSLGTSFGYNRPVAGLVLGALPHTLELAAAALVVAAAAAIALGVVAATHENRLVDRAVLGFTLLCQSVPTLGLGLLLAYYLAVQEGWFPAIGESGPSSFVLPTVTLAIGLLAPLTRTMRLGMIEALTDDYVRTARAKGVPEVRVLFRHAFANAAMPLITVLGLQVGWVLGGAFVVEDIYQWPGIGLLAVNAIQNRDFMVVQGVAIVAAVVFVTVNLIVDLAYGVLNPRVRLGYEA